MKYEFEVRETLYRKVAIEADNLGEGILEMNRRLEEEEIVLNAEDFWGGELRLKLGTTFFPQLEYEGEPVEKQEAEKMDLLIDCW